jgi:hypothetical protein
VGLHLGKGDRNRTPRGIVLETNPRGTKGIKQGKWVIKSSTGSKCRDEWKVEGGGG